MKASRQKHPTWLERNRAEYEQSLLLPLQHLARSLKAELSRHAPGYNFPQKGIGRMKVPAHWAAERGGRPYKGWMTYNSAPPRKSRFEHNPNLFFLINPDDENDPVLVAGGLYMPSSRQTRALREAIARDARPFEKLFADQAFSRSFPKGFSDEKISGRPARGFDPDHPQMHWLRLQAFFVWKPYSKKEFYSTNFPVILARDWKQILRLNRILETVLQGRMPATEPRVSRDKPTDLWERLESVSGLAGAGLTRANVDEFEAVDVDQAAVSQLERGNHR